MDKKICNGRLFLMVGAPGSGKSTFLKNHCKKVNQIIVSRDAIRFSMVNENEKYFSKENEVFAEYCRRINEELQKGNDVYADATHLNIGSRRKVLSKLSVKPTSINAIWIKTSLEDALKNNENRRGTRAYVPQNVIEQMFSSVTEPTSYEGFDNVYIVTNKRKDI